MVQVLPPKFNVGTQIGQALGQGIQKGSEQGFNRGMLQQALGKVKDVSQQPNVKPLDLMLSVMEAGAGIPGSERYLSTLLPMILNNARANNLFGEGTGQEESKVPPSLRPQQTEPKPGNDLSLDQSEPQDRQPGGHLPEIMTPEQIQEFGKKYAMELNDPNQYQTGIAIAERDNERAKQSWAELGNLAVSTGKVQQKELPEFMPFLQSFRNLAPNEAITNGVRQFAKYKNLTKQLDKVSFPGVGSNILRHGGGGAIPGYVIPSREAVLKRIQPTIKGLIDMGKEDEVRKDLAKKGLSPTEVSIAIHPLSPQLEKSIKYFPKSSYTPPDIREKKLRDFIEDNVTSQTSLLGLKDKLVREKGIPWKEIGPVIRQAVQEGKLALTPDQQAEMSTVDTEPPRGSLEGIFSEWSGIWRFLKGEK